MLKKILRCILPANIYLFIGQIKNSFLPKYYNISYSQEGEDMILNRIFKAKSNGFYIDVGAHHPKRFSNTNFFYKNGWSGINIDAMPGSMKRFNKARKRDINIEVPISNHPQTLTYYQFNEPALNGFNKELSLNRDGEKNYKIVNTTTLETTTLQNILKENIPVTQEIDFLSVDVEGHDFEVIQSLDLKQYRPKIILIEILSLNLVDLMSNEIAKYLKRYNYSFFSKSYYTIFFIEGNFRKEIYD